MEIAPSSKRDGAIFGEIKGIAPSKRKNGPVQKNGPVHLGNGAIFSWDGAISAGFTDGYYYYYYYCKGDPPAT